MNIHRQVREIYEKRPYPPVGKTSVTRPPWRLAPMEWIVATCQPPQPVPTRVLVAGCGTGLEAFALAKRFPRSEIVAVDFTPQSIAIARKLQKGAPKMRNIRFIVGDLMNRQFGKNIGGGFDFISCHGVLSYIPQPERALRNLARCLNPGGALYLGVNGAAHFSARWRQLLPAFGFKMTDFADGPYLREVLQLCEVLTGERAHGVAKRHAGYLAGDLFGPLIHNLPLSDWIRMCRDAGLYFAGSYWTQRGLRPVLNNDLCHLLMPRSRTEVCEMMEIASPSSFHRLVFSPRRPANPPWDKPDELLRWRPVVTDVYVRRWPKHKGSWGTFRDLRLKSPSTNTLVTLRAPEWELEILRQSDSTRPLGGILSQISLRIPRESLRRQLYLLYQLAAINLLPPLT